MKKFTLSAIACMLMGVFTTQAQITESFDVTEMPDGWTVINVEPLSSSWQFGPPPGDYTPHTGAGVAYINFGIISKCNRCIRSIYSFCFI